MKHSIYLIYSLSFLLLFIIILCEGVKPAEAKGKNGSMNEEEKNVDSEDESGNNANKFMEKLQPHFQQFGAPFQPLEHSNVNSAN